MPARWLALFVDEVSKEEKKDPVLSKILISKNNKNDLIATPQGVY